MINFTGTSGWSYPQWKKGIYQDCPQSRWLSCYADSFQAVELNSSFYRLPTEKSIHSWLHKTPDDFRFAVKAWRGITHDARLRECEEQLAQCLQLFRLFGDKLGPILFQLPPSLQYDAALLDPLLALLPADMKFVFEFRHVSWQNENVFSRLEKANVALCLSHMKDWLGPRIITSNLFYARLHGARGWFKGEYSADFLKDLTNFIRAQKHLKESYVFFNNTMENDDATKNALELKALQKR